MSLHKIETVRDTEHRLFALSGEGSGLALAVGRAKPLAEGVTLTLADQAGNAMVEIVAGKRGTAKVTVDGAEVFEIAHCKPGQKIEVDGEAFVVLAPFGIFVQARKREVEEAPAPVKMTTKKKVVAKKKRSPLLLAVAGLVCAAVVGLAMMPDPEEPPPEPVKQTVVAKPAPKKKVVQAPPPAPKPEPVVEETPAPVVEKPEPVREVAKVENPKPTPDKSPKPPKVKTPPAPEKPVLKSLPPEREASVRKQIESYQLEAGFDPDAAAAKLRKLKAELPADAAIRAEVDKALKGLPQ